MIVAVTPSRGLMHARTVAAVSDQIRARGGRWLTSHDLPIPECFERLTAEALSAGASAVWYVEEDVVPLPGTLEVMLALGHEMVLADYPLRDSPARPAYCVRDGRVLWMGLGCLLVRREAISRVDPPYFRTDVKMISYTSGSLQRRKTVKLVKRPRPYGGQDLYFSFRLLQAGATCGVLTGRADHLASEVSHLAGNVYCNGNTVDDCVGRVQPVQ